MDTRNWEQVLEGLRVPFSVEVVAWKPQTISRERKRCLAVPYADTQPYQERLDQVCPEWQDDYAIWFSDPQETLGRAGEKRVISGKVFVKCGLTIAERTRSDVGECELIDENALTSAKAQAFKRACAAFGLGRYLYDLPKPWVDYDAERGITEVELKKLEGLLRRYAGTHPAPAERSGPASETEAQSPVIHVERLDHVEHASRPVAAPLPAEANGQGVRARAGTNGYAAAGQNRQLASFEQPGQETRIPANGERASGASNEGRPDDEAGGPQPASSPAAGEERRESHRIQARKKVTERALAGKATSPAGTQPGDSVPPAPTIGSAAISAAGAESEGPVLCPIHNVPLQLLITREGKALLLHKIEGEGYCNGQEVRQVARG
jgi:hypothetical protein